MSYYTYSVEAQHNFTTQFTNDTVELVVFLLDETGMELLDENGNPLQME